jgi:hypothetical protein
LGACTATPILAAAPVEARAAAAILAQLDLVVPGEDLALLSAVGVWSAT